MIDQTTSRHIADELLNVFVDMATLDGHEPVSISHIAAYWLKHAEWAGVYHATSGSHGPTADAVRFIANEGMLDESAGDSSTGPEFLGRIGRILYSEDTSGFYDTTVWDTVHEAKREFGSFVAEYLTDPPNDCTHCGEPARIAVTSAGGTVYVCKDHA